MEYLGVQEEMLVEAVEEHLKGHGSAAALVEELEGVSFFSFFLFHVTLEMVRFFADNERSQALDDEAEDLVKKLWRMVIFFTECEKRGLPA